MFSRLFREGPTLTLTNSPNVIALYTQQILYNPLLSLKQMNTGSVKSDLSRFVRLPSGGVPEYNQIIQNLTHSFIGDYHKNYNPHYGPLREDIIYYLGLQQLFSTKLKVALTPNQSLNIYHYCIQSYSNPTYSMLTFLQKLFLTAFQINLGGKKNRGTHPISLEILKEDDELSVIQESCTDYTKIMNLETGDEIMAKAGKSLLSIRLRIKIPLFFAPCECLKFEIVATDPSCARYFAPLEAKIIAGELNKIHHEGIEGAKSH